MMTLIAHIRKCRGKQPLYIRTGYPESLHQITQKMDVKTAIRTSYNKCPIAGPVKPPLRNAKAHNHQSHANIPGESQKSPPVASEMLLIAQLPSSEAMPCQLARNKAAFSWCSWKDLDLVWIPTTDRNKRILKWPCKA